MFDPNVHGVPLALALDIVIQGRDLFAKAQARAHGETFLPNFSSSLPNQYTAPGLMCPRVAKYTCPYLSNSLTSYTLNAYILGLRMSDRFRSSLFEFDRLGLRLKTLFQQYFEFNWVCVPCHLCCMH
jgi:hypothetical protein